MHPLARTALRQAAFLFCLASALAARQGVAEASGGLARVRSLVEGSVAAEPVPVMLALPEGERLAVRLERFEHTTTGARTARGALEGEADGYAAFAAWGGAFAGVLRRGEALYRVRETAQGTLVLVRDAGHAAHGCEAVAAPLSGAALPGKEASTGPPSRAGAARSGAAVPSRAVTPGPLRPTFAPQSPSSVGDTVVDLLVCWTQEAALAAGSQAAIRALIELAALETNLAFDNSGVALHVRVVHAQGVPYTESGSMAVDLERLRVDGDGFLDPVHPLRTQYGADVVSLFVANTSACGRSYNMGDPPSAGFAAFAFHLVSQGCATGYYAFGHELGHNFGLNHERPAATGVPSWPWAYGYWSPDDTHRTIMALERSGNFGVRVPFYSSPNVSYAGFPLGIAAPDPDAADCARALNDNAAIIAAWRPTLTP